MRGGWDCGNNLNFY